MVFLSVWRYFHEQRELKKTYKRYIDAAKPTTNGVSELRWQATEDSIDESIKEKEKERENKRKKKKESEDKIKLEDVKVEDTIIEDEKVKEEKKEEENMKQEEKVEKVEENGFENGMNSNNAETIVLFDDKV